MSDDTTTTTTLPLRDNVVVVLACARPHPRVPLAIPVIIPGPVVRVRVISGTGTGHRPGSQGLPVMNPKNAYLLPLIPELIDNMKESTLFTKFDICWGYNNIRIREEDQWKAAFITPMGLFEPTVMFFGFCNAPPTFQAFMNHIFTDMIREKWLKIYMDDLSIHTKDDLNLHHERTRRVLQ